MTRPRTPSEILDAAGDLLAQPGAWTQGTEARDEQGGKVFGHSDYAVCWCAYGAVRRVGWGRYVWAYLKLVTDGKPVFFNDAPDRTQSEVVAAFRKAAALAREAGE